MKKEDLEFAYFYTAGHPIIKRIMEGDMDDCDKIIVDELFSAVNAFGILANDACKYIDGMETKSDCVMTAYKIIGKMQHHVTHCYCMYEVVLSAVKRGKKTSGDLHARLVAFIYDFNACMRFIKDFVDGNNPTEIKLFDKWH